VVRYNSNFGAQLLYATAEYLRVMFVTVTPTLRDGETAKGNCMQPDV
jgi:hypothetical protein